MPGASGDQDRGSAALIAVIHEEGVHDERVLDAFRRVPRERFVPTRLIGSSSLDRPIPIPHGQVTTQPSLIARILEALGLVGTERVLEVGTGLGFQTALLAHLADEVVSIERFLDLAGWARRNLEAAGIENVRVVVGDGTLGAPDAAPFDAIVVSAASPQVPAPLVEQLAEGGRLVHPVGPGGEELVFSFLKEGGSLVRERLIVPAHFVRLVGAHGLPDEPFEGR
jgi:protein-L-isoaspartate(D-aspartate) O-methyltransferase